MASYPYPPWSAPASLKKDREKSSWWRNAKQALKKPWTRKQKSKEHRKTKSTDSAPVVAAAVAYNPYNVFSPEYLERRPTYPIFQPHFSPSNPLQNQPRFSNYDPRGFTPFESHTPPQTETDLSIPGTFEPPVASKPNRPLLTDVFPRYDSPKLIPQQQNQGPRRYSTGGVNLPNPSRRPLRSSDQSVQSAKSDGIGRRHRRDIRGGMRVIPILPQRQDDRYRALLSTPMQQKGVQQRRRGLEYDETDSTHSSGNQHRYPPQQARNLYSAYNQAYSPYHGNREGFHSSGNPQSSSGGFSYQHAPPQNKTLLQELEDEIDGEGDSEESYKPDFATKLRAIKEEDTGDNIKGFDTFMMY